MSSAFTARDVSFRYRNATRDAVADLSFDVPRGSFYALLGPNGSGKSTVMRLMLGALLPQQGEVRFEQRPVADWPRRDLAQRIGVVSQSEEMPFPMTVR
ncbi:MAG: ATP-binding cassette domain-containing protein, partial [Longimicrobiales bacterium]